jgi:hypothetical protein
VQRHTVRVFKGEFDDAEYLCAVRLAEAVGIDVEE